MSEVLRALALRAIEWGNHDNLSLDQEHIADIICNEIMLAPEEVLHLPMPKTDRVTKVANAITDNYSINKSLEE